MPCMQLRADKLLHGNHDQIDKQSSACSQSTEQLTGTMQLCNAASCDSNPGTQKVARAGVHRSRYLLLARLVQPNFLGNTLLATLMRRLHATRLANAPPASCLWMCTLASIQVLTSSASHFPDLKGI